MILIKTGLIEPIWDIEEFRKLNYKIDTHKDTALIDDYERAGHFRQSMTLFNYFEPNPMPQVVHDHIVPYFGYNNASVAVNLFEPGQYLPVHSDLFGRYRQIHGLDKDIRIYRTIVMLEDSSPGQLIQVDDRAWAFWRTGWWIEWEGDTPHAFYNLSFHNRYAVQITGTKG